MASRTARMSAMKPIVQFPSAPAVHSAVPTQDVQRKLRHAMGKLIGGKSRMRCMTYAHKNLENLWLQLSPKPQMAQIAPHEWFQSMKQMPRLRAFQEISGNLKHLQVKTLFNVLPYKVGAEIADCTVVRLSCSDNTQLYGSDLNLCLNRKWQGSWSDCKSRCHRKICTRDPSIRSACHYNPTLANMTFAPGYKPKEKTSWQTRTCVEHPNHQFGFLKRNKIAATAFPNVALQCLK